MDKATFLTIGVPTFVVLIGIIWSRIDYKNLRDELVDTRKELRGDISSVERKVEASRAEIRNEAKSLQGEITALRDMWHNDVVRILEILREHDSRVARLEERH